MRRQLRPHDPSLLCAVASRSLGSCDLAIGQNRPKPGPTHIGAVDGVQQFGSECLPDGSPMAEDPHYLARFATERTVTVNTTAAGGNAILLTLGSSTATTGTARSRDSTADSKRGRGRLAKV